MYRVALTYHPEVGTFRGHRGAWRVAKCWPALVGARSWGPDNICTGQVYKGGHRSSHALFMDVAQRLPTGVWVNPTKLLREYLATRRPISPQRRYA